MKKVKMFFRLRAQARACKTLSLFSLFSLVLFSSADIPDNEPVDTPHTLDETRVHSLALQSGLDRHGFGVGLLDGAWGPKSQQAFDDFRASRNITHDEAAFALTNDAPLLLAFNLPNDFARHIYDTPTDWEEAAALTNMPCRTLLDWLAEKFHQHPNLTVRLNPHITDWNAPGTNVILRVVNIRPATFKTPRRVERIEINTQKFRLRAFDANNTILLSFPCSIARDKTRVPTGELVITTHAPNPNFTFDPANYPTNPRAQEIGRKLILPPGPRNPVGVYWMSLSLPGYGIHGTPKPETIGNMESLGCFRLCNWDAQTLGNNTRDGIPVRLVP